MRVILTMLKFICNSSLRYWKSFTRTLHRKWKPVTCMLFLLVLATYFLGMKTLFTTLPHQLRLKQVDFQPIPYTRLGKCDPKPDGSIYCPDIRNKGSTSLRRAQLVLTRVLRIFDIISKKHGIKYWLCKGTLLGAVRHNGHNPFDNDVDICIPKVEYQKFIESGVSELPDDIFFQTEDTDVHYKTPPQSGMLGKLRDTKSCYKYCLRGGCKHEDGLMIDMLVLEKDRDGNFIELFSHTNWLLRRFIYGPIIRKESDIFPLTEMNFDGFSIPAPREWSKILKSYYGDFMRIPYGAPPAFLDSDALRSCEEIRKS